MKTKTFLQKVILQLVVKKFLWLKELKILCCWHVLLVILVVKKLLKSFAKKNGKKINQKGLRVEKLIKRKGDKLYVRWKGCNNSFNSWIDKKRLSINE